MGSLSDTLAPDLRTSRGRLLLQWCVRLLAGPPVYRDGVFLGVAGCAAAGGDLGFKQPREPGNKVRVAGLEVSLFSGIAGQVKKLHGGQGAGVVAAGARKAPAAGARTEGQLPRPLANRKRAIAGMRNQ